jgi:uncharacterized damage-inducible protein DinB
MELVTIEGFLSYYEKTRQNTLRVIAVIPHDKMDWAYMPGKFSIGDLIRHIAAIERNVFAAIAAGGRPCYTGCGKELADGYANIISWFHEMHRQSVGIFRSLPDEALRQKIKSLDGKDVELGHFLRALFVHEIHHRGALCIYLNLLGVPSPPVIGLKEEEVIQLSK